MKVLSLQTADVSPREEEHRSATIQKFHTNDVNQCLYNISCSDGVPNANLFNFTFLDFGQVLCLLIYKRAPTKLSIDCFLIDSSRLTLFCLLSFVCHL